MSLSELGKQPAPSPTSVRCTVKKAPVDVGDTVRVVVPSFSHDRFYEVDHWDPRGAAFPAQGDEGLLTFDEDGEPWLLWDGDFTPAEGATLPILQSDVTGLTAALSAKQDASTAATDSELAAHAALSTAHGISTFGATLVDDSTAAIARSTLGLATYTSLLENSGLATGLGSITTTKSTFNSDGTLSTPGGVRAPFLLYLDDADFQQTSGSLKLRLRAQILTNATAPGITITVGLYPITASAGGAGVLNHTIGTVVSGSTIAFTTPSASSQNQGNSGDFTFPSDGYYALGAVGSGTQAANSALGMTAQLQVRNA